MLKHWIRVTAPRGALLVGALFAALPVSASPLYSLPVPSAEQIAAVKAPSTGGFRFATELAATLDSATDGVWFERDERRIWQASVFADNAVSLSFQFDQLEWPVGAELLLTAPDGSQQGPYQAQDIRNGRLWTSMLLGERVNFEWSLPRNGNGQAHLRLAKAYYGVSDAGGYRAKHGACNIDTVCSGCNPYADEIDSTVLLQYVQGGEQFSCSGFLVNNARNDRTPYILTANHCQITAAVQDSVQIYWRYEDSSCGNQGHGNFSNHPIPNVNFSITGAQVLATGRKGDFTLLLPGTRANPKLPQTAWQPYWTGWDVGVVAPQSGLSVHHPSGNQKSISLFNDPAVATSTQIDDNRPEVWQVQWDQGTTEQGSSGSGLWNQDGRVVGVLSGGEASCGNRNGADFYARLNVAWEEAPSCDGQLKCWLDPDSSGATKHDGIGPSTTSSQMPKCSSDPVVTPGGGGSGSVPVSLLLMLCLSRRKKTVKPSR